jgi:hypothetical protein
MHECAFGHEPLRNRAANAAVATSDDGDTPWCSFAWFMDYFDELHRRQRVRNGNPLGTVELAEKIFAIFIGPLGHQPCVKGNR